MKKILTAVITIMMIATMAITASAKNVTLNPDEFRQCGGYAFYDENGTITHGSYVIWSSVENNPDVRYDISNGFKIEIRNIIWAEEGNTAITIVVGTPPDPSVDPSERTWIAISGHIVFIIKKDGSVFISDGASSILATADPIYNDQAIDPGFDSFVYSIVRNEEDDGWLLSVDDKMLVEYEDKFEGYTTNRYGVYPIALTEPTKATFGFGVLNGDALAMDAVGNIAYTVSAIKIAESLTINHKTSAAYTGDSVTAKAPVIEGKEFTGWEAEGIDLGENASNAEITFVMPDNAVTLTATYDGEEIDVTDVTDPAVSTGENTTGPDTSEEETTDVTSGVEEGKKDDNNNIIMIAVIVAAVVLVVVVVVIVFKKKK